MKHLIVFAHPLETSLNANWRKKISSDLIEQGHQVVERNLYELNFDPILSSLDMEGQRMGIVADDVALEQQFITWADSITLIYPIWWTGMPAILKGYIDRVFSYGFAYCYHQGMQQPLLTGKTVLIINTHGKSARDYESNGMNKALSLTSDTGIFQYCGLEIKRHFYFDSADRATQQMVMDWTNQISQHLKTISVEMGAQ